MISIERGLEMVASLAQTSIGPDFMPPEAVPLADAIGRILREDVCLDADSPPFDRSIRDGFALRAEDIVDVPQELRVIGESRAGDSFEGVVGRGECCEIMTGAAVPGGADAVVMVEYTEACSDGGRVRIQREVGPGQSIQRMGTEALAGDRILSAGRAIRTPDLGVLASVGRVEVQVSRKPRVAILSTGDELVEVGESPHAGQIRNGNSYTLYAQCVEAGAEPEMLGIARDDPGDLSAKVSRGLQRDILVTSGGVSMGKYDFVERVFEDHGVELHFDKVAMKPGKPTVFGSRGRTFVFGLPGNPVSTMVSFQLFVRPLIRSLLQVSDDVTDALEAILAEPVRCDLAREACVPATVRFEDGAYRLSPVDWKGSSDLVGLSRANAYVMIPRREGSLEAGATVRFIPMRGH